VKRGWFILLLALLPLRAVADGKVIPSLAFTADVTIPDQRALIHFTNGIERLVIETRFSAEGTNFAWIVPLPAAPIIEPATTGLFPTLDYLFQPHIRYRAPKFFIAILVMLAVGWIGVRYGWRTAFLVVVFIAVAVSLLLPALGTARGRVTAVAGDAVFVIDRRTVGAYDTATIASLDAQAILAWLSDNGFAQPATITNALQSYATNGWVFVAAKVRRDAPGFSTNAVHPLSFTFKTHRAVYPMRLTGAGAENNVTVELYVFGPGRAAARHFEVDSCLRASYAETGNVGRIPSRDSTEVVIQHPLLRAWVSNAPFATKLTATLSPSQMEQDVWIDWKPARETRKTLYSYAAGTTVGLNWGTLAFALVLVVLVTVRKGDRPLKLFSLGPAWSAVLCGALVTAVVWAILPMTEVELRRRFGGHPGTVWRLATVETATNAAQARIQIRRMIDDQPDYFENQLLGGRIREEDSPGNFTLRETNGQVQFIIYDANGAAHVAPPDN